jgi:hypothetical protein
MTPAQDQLKAKHGTPAEFSKACLAACPGWVSVDEANTAIVTYQAEWDLAGRSEPEIDSEGDEMLGDEILRFSPRDEDKPGSDCAIEYSIRQEPEAIGGLIVYARYQRGWVCNPNLRHVVRELLIRLQIMH